MSRFEDLSPACRDFRVADPSGHAPDPHRAACPACAAWAAALDDARRSAPLPAALRARLLSIPDPGVVREVTGDAPADAAAPPAVPSPLPAAPLPPALRERLVAIGRDGAAPPARPPFWLSDARPLLAASYLLACVVGAFAGGFQAFGDQAVESTTRVTSVVQTSTRALRGRMEQAPMPDGDGVRRVVDPVMETLDRATGQAVGEIERRWREHFPERPETESLETPTPPASGPERDEETTDDPRPRQVRRPELAPARTEASA